MLSMGVRKFLNYTWNWGYTAWNKNVIWWFHPNSEQIKHHIKSVSLHYALSLITSCTAKTCKTVYVAVHQIHVLWWWRWQQQLQNTHTFTVAHCSCRTFILNSWWKFFHDTHIAKVSKRTFMIQLNMPDKFSETLDSIATSLYVHNK